MDQLFKIFKINTQRAQQISTAPDPPHSHNYEELIIGLKGKIEYFIDFKNIGGKLSRPLGVEFYAEKLFTSTLHLNLICKKFSGKPLQKP